MNRICKRLLLGLVIWVIPFVASIFVWDPAAGVPTISLEWFNALMAFMWVIGLSLALYFYFRDVKKKDAAREGLVTGATWFVELVVLDFLVLVLLFGMPASGYLPLVLMYVNNFTLAATVGYLKA